jgi:hypothetical protein
MTLVLFLTTWQAGQTRKGFRICACLLGIPKPFFTLRVATRFCKTLEYHGRYLEEKQKEPEPDTDKNQHLTPVIISSFS